MGGAILARPSWALFVPIILVAWVVGAGRANRGRALVGALVVALATAGVMTPWWVRNARVVGRFVPTALWVGASLYDGISPEADGSSAMEFVDAPDVRSLGEVEQDQVFRDRAVDFARSHPGRVLALAWVKLGRFWSPWPNADTLRNRWAAIASALVTIPVFALIGLGVWDRRRDPALSPFCSVPCSISAGCTSCSSARSVTEFPAWYPPLAWRGSAGCDWKVGCAVEAQVGVTRARPTKLARARRRPRDEATFLGSGSWSCGPSLSSRRSSSGASSRRITTSTEGDTLVEVVRREAPRYLPGARFDLIRARIKPFAGEVVFHAISLGDGGPGGPASVAQLPYLQINYNPWAMLHGRFEPSLVVVPRPTIRLRRRPDGTWNFQGLLADPWPGPRGGTTPPIQVKDGTVELIGDEAGTLLKVLTDVSVDIPAVAAGEPIPFELSAKGDLFERFRVPRNRRA